MVLGFDAVNRERATRTLPKLVAQPIYRDAIINGKFLAGMTTVAILFLAVVLMIAGLGLWILGVVPGLEEIARLGLYLVISIVYVGFWLGLGILFSVLFRGMGTSALATLAVWIFLAFFVGLAIKLVADSLVPLPADPTSDLDALIRNERIQRLGAYVSPIALYSDAAAVVLDPLRKTTRSLILIGPMERLSLSRFQNPLPLDQSALVVAPHLVSLLALTVLCFGVCYACFMRQEVRAT
jgi:ABC-2 type transport system permease protein